MLDCLIIGGGPAGLTAAIYLARFHLNVEIIDAGHSRAHWIPETHNHAGYPEGIGGSALLERMRRQAEEYGATIRNFLVSRLSKLDDMFTANVDATDIAAATVLLATGVVNRRPEMDDTLHDQALKKGLLRYCPICDGFEVTDQNVAVVGTGKRGLAEAEFMRSYTRDVTLISPDGPHDLDAAQGDKARWLGIQLVDGPVKVDRIDEGQIIVKIKERELYFETLYPALGSDVNNRLAKMLDASCGDDDGITVDRHQRTSVPGLYAAGDVVIGLDQISHAMGEGGVAAVTIRNDLNERSQLLR